MLFLQLSCAFGHVAARPAEDPFLWLEDIHGERAMAWVEGQNARTREALIDTPEYRWRFDAALKAATSGDSLRPVHLQGAHVLQLQQDATHKRGLWRRASLQGFLASAPRWETLLDIDALAQKEGENWVFQHATCLPPARERCMVSLSRGGGDAGVAREFNVSARAFVADGFVLPEGRNFLAWVDADTLMVATALSPDETTQAGFPRQVREWKRGHPLKDAPVVFAGEPGDMAVAPMQELEGASAGIMRRVSFQRSDLYLRRAGKFERLALPEGAEFAGFAGQQAVLRLVQPAGGFPEGAVVAGDLATGRLNGLFVPRPGQSVTEVAVGRTAVYVSVLDDVAGKLLRFQPHGGTWRARPLALPQGGVIGNLRINPDGDDLFVSHQTPVIAQTRYYFDAAGKGRSLPGDRRERSSGVVLRYSATSRDGTRIPYSVIGQEQVLKAGNARTVQFAYGGMGAMVLPRYSPVREKLWIERGGVYVIAHIRGGGEFGPQWHRAATRTNRQRAFDDFFAVSEDLIARGITTPGRLGAWGGSNGGLLMGVALTQRPELYAAIVCAVPLLDMMRYHTLLVGASWIDEYGSPEVPQEREALLKYSPYQNLRPGVACPEVLFISSTTDDRVHPGHARKMAAKMERNGQPFLYLERAEGGHDGGADPALGAQFNALMYAFFDRKLSGGFARPDDPHPGPGL